MSKVEIEYGRGSSATIHFSPEDEDNPLVRALRSVLADRERELLELKGPCSRCRLHYAHSGPCAEPEVPGDSS